MYTSGCSKHAAPAPFEHQGGVGREARASGCAQGGELTVEQLQEQKRFLEEDRDHEREERNYFQVRADVAATLALPFDARAVC